MTNSTKTSWSRRLFWSGVSALAIMPAPLYAQADADSNDDDDVIVVTARTFEENLQEVPIAVSVLTADDLEKQALDDLSDIAEKTVGFAFEGFTGILAQPSVRGQTNLRVTSPVQNVATYVDGVYLQRGFLIDQSLLDLDRVEIVKGPQSALYGRNAFAGVINLTTKKPSLTEITGKVKVGVGTDERRDVSATISIPIIEDKLAILGSISHSQFDGTRRNNHPLANADGVLTSGNLGGFNRESYQARVIAKPIEEVTIDVLYVHTDRFQEHVPSYILSTTSGLEPFNTLNASPLPGAFGPPVENRLFVGELPTQVQLVPGEARPPGLVIDPRAFGLEGPTDLVSAKIEVDASDAVSLSYQLGYTFGDVDGRGSTSRNPTVPLFFGGFFPVGMLFDAAGNDSSFEGWSHDFRISYNGDNIRGFLGVNYSDTSDIESGGSIAAPVLETTISDAVLDAAFFEIGPGLPFGTSLLRRRTFLERQEEIWGIYGFLEIDLSDVFSVTLEGRYTFEDQEAIDFLTPDPVDPTLQSANPETFSRSDEFFAPRFTVNYQPSLNNLIFASVARGVKSGGLNGIVDFIPQRTYDPETNWTFEIGSKNVFPDIGLTLNGAIYYTDWQDLQTTAVRLQADGTSAASAFIVPTVTDNIASADIFGIELEGIWQLNDNVTLDFGASYNRARYKDGETSQRLGAAGVCDGIVCPVGTVPAGGVVPEVPIGGNQIERTPEFDAFAGLGYNGQIVDNLDFFIRGDVTYQTKQFVDEANLAFVGDRFLANLQAGVTSGPVSVNFWVRNLFNKDFVSSSLFLAGTGGFRSSSYVPILGERRTVGINASFNF